jgi:hypothetical protein
MDDDEFNIGRYASIGSGTAVNHLVVKNTGDVSISGNLTSANTIGNEDDSYTGTAKVSQMVTLSQVEYDAIGTPDANTMYIII